MSRSTSALMIKDLTVKDLRTIIREETTTVFEELKTRIANVEEKVGQALELQAKVSAIETSLQFNADQLQDIEREKLPALKSELDDVASALTLRMLDLEVHRRKWSITIHGMKGNPGEDEAVTRQKCVDLAKDHLQVPDACAADLAACHRLSQSQDAGVILRFVDLSKRNKWLAGARHLRGHPDRINICPDLPPLLRPLKTQLLDARKAMPPAQKSKTSLRYLAQWPYVEMATSGGGPRVQHTTPLKQIVRSALDLGKWQK